MASLVAIVGLPGAGKSQVTEVFEQKGYCRVYFGALTLEKLQAEGKEVNEANERTMRESLRKEYGMEAYAALNLSKIDQARQNGDVIIDGLYSWEEYTFLKDIYPTLAVVAVYAPPKLRYSRLAERPIRPLTEAEAKSRDYSQIEQLHQAGPIAMADWTFLNVGSVEELIHQVQSYIDDQK